MNDPATLASARWFVDLRNRNRHDLWVMSQGDDFPPEHPVRVALQTLVDELDRWELEIAMNRHSDPMPRDVAEIEQARRERRKQLELRARGIS